MPLNPQIQAVLEQRAAVDQPPLNTLTPAQAWANAEARPPATGPEVANVEDRTIPGPAGEILVYFHGGGWVVGTLDMSDGTCRNLCVGGECVVISADYRLAPEAKFPAPADDCYAVTEWVSRNASAISADLDRIAVGGGSAGANLAAAVCLMARDRGGPALAFQLLVYPVTDRNFETASYRQNAEGYMLTRDSMIWYWDQYLNNASDASDPYAAPLQAGDLAGLPPALVMTAEFDPLRDEGEAYADRLEAAGVPTQCIRYDGMVHGFFGMHDSVDKAREAVTQASAAPRGAFTR